MKLRWPARPAPSSEASTLLAGLKGIQDAHFQDPGGEQELSLSSVKTLIVPECLGALTAAAAPSRSASDAALVREMALKTLVLMMESVNEMNDTSIVELEEYVELGLVSALLSEARSEEASARARSDAVRVLELIALCKRGNESYARLMDVDGVVDVALKASASSVPELKECGGSLLCALTTQRTAGRLFERSPVVLDRFLEMVLSPHVSSSKKKKKQGLSDQEFDSQIMAVSCLVSLARARETALRSVVHNDSLFDESKNGGESVLYELLIELMKEERTASALIQRRKDLLHRLIETDVKAHLDDDDDDDGVFLLLYEMSGHTVGRDYLLTSEAHLFPSLIRLAKNPKEKGDVELQRTLLVYLTAANLAHGDEHRTRELTSVKLSQGALGLVVEALREYLEEANLVWEDDNEPLRDLRALVAFEANREPLHRCGIVPLMDKALAQAWRCKDVLNIDMCLLILTQLSHSDPVSTLLKSMDSLLATVGELTKWKPYDQDWSNVRNAARALKSRVSESPPSLLRSVSSSYFANSESQVPKSFMISYAWGEPPHANKRLAKSIAEILKRKYKAHVWLDQDFMSGDLVQAMSEGVTNADVVLVLITTPYLDSVNCQTELVTAHKNHKRIVPLLVEAKLAKKLNVLGWLSVIIKNVTCHPIGYGSGTLESQLEYVYQTEFVEGNESFADSTTTTKMQRVAALEHNIAGLDVETTALNQRMDSLERAIEAAEKHILRL